MKTSDVSKAGHLPLSHVLDFLRSYEKRRIIVRQGHPGFCFYFIVSGSVSVTVTRKDVKTGISVTNTVDVLVKNDAFGVSASVPVIHYHLQTLGLSGVTFHLLSHACIYRYTTDRVYQLAQPYLTRTPAKPGPTLPNRNTSQIWPNLT